MSSILLEWLATDVLTCSNDQMTRQTAVRVIVHKNICFIYEKRLRAKYADVYSWRRKPKVHMQICTHEVTLQQNYTILSNADNHML